MSGVSLATARAAASARSTPRAAPVLATIATAFLVLGAGFLAVASPWYLHGALDRSGSDLWLGLPRDVVHAISDSTLTELFVGPGTFAQTFSDPATGATTRFYGPTEASHLRDAQLLARLFVVGLALSVGGLAAAVLRTRDRAWLWRSVQRGAAGSAGALVLVGIFFAVAFEPAFTLFHEIFFPQGNWEFDPLQARMVQLYDPAFWNELTVVFAVASVAGAIVVWLFARARLDAVGSH